MVCYTFRVCVCVSHFSPLLSFSCQQQVSHQVYRLSRPWNVTTKPMYRIYWPFCPSFSHIISLKGSRDGVTISEERANALSVLSPPLMLFAQWSYGEGTLIELKWMYWLIYWSFSEPEWPHEKWHRPSTRWRHVTGVCFLGSSATHDVKYLSVFYKLLINNGDRSGELHFFIYICLYVRRQEKRGKGELQYI